MAEKEFKGYLPKRKPATHKGDYGHVLILAGSAGFTGAAALCSLGALRAGSGLVTLAVPRSLNATMEAKLTEVITKPLPETRELTLSQRAESEIKDLMKRVDVVAIGPGLSTNPETESLVRDLIASSTIPLVIDADGINALIGVLPILRKARAPLVLTPHPGEMSRLLAMTKEEVQKARERVTADFAKDHKLTLVLKGYQTVVSTAKGETYVNKTGNPGMATAGSGDILTGMIASFIGQGLEPFKAAKLAVYLHGLAGDLAAEEKGQISLIASDILDKLSGATKTLKEVKT